MFNCRSSRSLYNDNIYCGSPREKYNLKCFLNVFDSKMSCFKVHPLGDTVLD